MKLKNTLCMAASLLLSALLLAGCGQTADTPATPAAPAPDAAVTAAPVESARPEPEEPPAAYTGALADREGRELDPALYPELKGAQTTFMDYLSAGDTVCLTVDLSLQDRAAEILTEDLRGAPGSAVVVRVDTGEPLAIVSAGGADALTSEYQPYGLFFPCTAIAALSENVVTPETTVKCNGVYDRYSDEGYAPECWIWDLESRMSWADSGYTHPEETVTTALRDGCDYFFYSLGNDLGIDRLSKYVSALGLGQPTGIELTESVGRIAAAAEGREWGIRDAIETAAGRGGSAFTTLQYAEYCAALANRGARYSASILSSVTDADGAAVYAREAQALTDSPLAESEAANWDAVQQGMYETMNNRFNEALYRIHSQNQWKLAGEYGYGDDCQLFMGYAPYDAPQIAVAVAVERSDGDFTVDMSDPASGAFGAAQLIAQEIFEAYLGK